MKILLTGGSGLLGQELQKHLEVDAPSHGELDVTKPTRKDYDLIVHAAAYTDVLRAEKEWEKCMEVNYFGTRKLREMYREVPFVYISSEYASSTTKNHYGFTKWLGESVTMQYKPYLIIRTLFKPNPFPWDKAFTDQYTQGDYVDVIAKLIAKEINMWSRRDSRLMYIGTGRKSIFELAKQTRPDVKPCSIDDITEVKLPKDYQ